MLRGAGGGRRSRLPHRHHLPICRLGVHFFQCIHHLAERFFGQGAGWGDGCGAAAEAAAVGRAAAGQEAATAAMEAQGCWGSTAQGQPIGWLQGRPGQAARPLGHSSKPHAQELPWPV